MCMHHRFGRSEYFFNFDQPFEIHDDIEILRRMGLTFGLGTGACTPEVRFKCLRVMLR